MLQAIFLQIGVKVWSAQVYELSSMHFLPKEWIMERWEDGFYIKDSTCSPPTSDIDKVYVTPSRQLCKALRQGLAGKSAPRRRWF